MDKIQIEMMLERLAHTRIDAGPYFSKDYPALNIFLDGFLYGIRALGFEVEPEYTKLWSERGLNADPHGPIYEMQQAGLPIDEITAEVFGVLIIALQRKYGLSTEPILKTHQGIRKTIDATRSSLEKPLPSLSEEANKNHYDPILDRLDFEIVAIEKLERQLGISSSDSEDK